MNENLKKIWNAYSADAYSADDNIYNISDMDQYYEEIRNKYIEDYVENSWKKTVVEDYWKKTEVETDEEKLEKMDLGTIEKFLRKKKLEQLAKSDE